jgi:hypothetical protein
MTRPVSTENKDEIGQSQYSGLRSARGALHGMADLFYVLAGLSILGSLIAGAISMSASSTLPRPSYFSPGPLIAAGALFLLAIVFVITGWNVSMAAERLGIEIETIDRVRQLVYSAKASRDDIHTLVGKLEMQLRNIAASSARTAAAVESLASSVRRPPPDA